MFVSQSWIGNTSTSGLLDGRLFGDRIQGLSIPVSRACTVKARHVGHSGKMGSPETKLLKTSPIAEKWADGNRSNKKKGCRSREKHELARINSTFPNDVSCLGQTTVKKQRVKIAHIRGKSMLMRTERLRKKNGDVQKHLAALRFSNLQRHVQEAQPVAKIRTKTVHEQTRKQRLLLQNQSTTAALGIAVLGLRTVVGCEDLRPSSQSARFLCSPLGAGIWSQISLGTDQSGPDFRFVVSLDLSSSMNVLARLSQFRSPSKCSSCFWVFGPQPLSSDKLHLAAFMLPWFADLPRSASHSSAE